MQDARPPGRVFWSRSWGHVRGREPAQNTTRISKPNSVKLKGWKTTEKQKRALSGLKKGGLYRIQVRVKTGKSFSAPVEVTYRWG